MPKILIDIPDRMNELIHSDSQIDWMDMSHILYAIENGTPLDGLTNGEFMEKFLGAKRVHELHTDVEVMIVRIGKSFMAFDLSWWNAKWGEQA